MTKLKSVQIMSSYNSTAEPKYQNKKIIEYLEKTLQLTAQNCPKEEQVELEEKVINPIITMFDDLPNQQAADDEQEISHNSFYNELKEIIDYLLNDDESEKYLEILSNLSQSKGFCTNIEKLEILKRIIGIIANWVHKNKNISDIKKITLRDKLKKNQNILDKERRRLIFQKPSDKEEFIATLKWLYENAYEQDDLNLIQKVWENPFYSREDIENEKSSSLGISSGGVERLFKMTEEAIKNRLFEFKGQDTPFGDYPAPMVPIGYHKGYLAAVYPESKDEPFMKLEDYNTYTKQDDTIYFSYSCNDEQFLKKRKSTPQQSEDINFDYREHRLFALSENLVICYSVEEEKEFFQNLLEDKEFSQENPFLRRSLAKLTEDVKTIQQELIHCVQFFNKNTDDAQTMISDWYEDEKEKLESIWNNLGLEFPSENTLKELATSKTL
ncbi:MAG: hypothetical protein F6K10_06055 [Moorea sp. SIO2B7]|nr:hypothetical protein [Moorena sp. SIO2B7]